MIKRIPNQLIKDYMITGGALTGVLLLLHPIFLTPDLRQTSIPLLVFKIVHALCLFLSLILSEMVVTYLFNRPFSYTDSIWKQLLHFALCIVIGFPLFDALLIQSNVLMKFGFHRLEYAWIDYDGTFTLKWYMMSFNMCAFSFGIIATAMMGMTKVRNIQYSLRELVTTNQILQSEQKQLRSRLSKDNETNKIIIHGDSRESLIVNPLDIMYVESVGNYLDIVYFNDSDLCQKRLRSSLKEVEEMLEAFPFMVHTHRAFLVNINFITQVSGNSAGYKLKMFSTDKILPVSKANVNCFREAISEIGKNLE